MSEQSPMLVEEGLGFGPFALYPLQKLLLERGAPVDLGSRVLAAVHAVIPERRLNLRRACLSLARTPPKAQK